MPVPVPSARILCWYVSYSPFFLRWIGRRQHAKAHGGGKWIIAATAKNGVQMNCAWNWALAANFLQGGRFSGSAVGGGSSSSGYIDLSISSTMSLFQPPQP